MTIKTRWMTLFAAGLLISSVAARAQGATAPDPNVAPSTGAVEVEIPRPRTNLRSRLPRTRT